MSDPDRPTQPDPCDEECECHIDAGFCDRPNCLYWPNGQDPDPDEDGELAAPPLEVTFRDRR